MDKHPFTEPLAEHQNQGDEIFTVTNQLTNLLGQLDFERARNLARKGDYPAAQAILLSLLRKQPNAEVYDLLARIYAQQGLNNEARLMWNKALAIDPNSPGYASGLALLTSEPKHLFTRLPVIKNIIILISVLGLVLALIFFSSRLDLLRISINETGLTAKNLPPIISENSPIITIVSNFPTEIASLTDKLDTNNQELMTMLQSNQETLDQISANTDILLHPTEIEPLPLPLVIDVPGTSTTPILDGLQLRFDERLFLYGTYLTPRGEELLSQVGHQLEPWIGKIHVKVVGFSDSFEKDKINLPFDRGSATVKYLISNSRLPVNIFSISSGTGQPSPFPSDSNIELYLERTVVIEITFTTD